MRALYTSCGMSNIDKPIDLCFTIYVLGALSSVVVTQRVKIVTLCFPSSISSNTDVYYHDNSEIVWPSDRFPFGRQGQTGVGTDELLSPARPCHQVFLLRFPSLTNQTAKRPDVPLCDQQS